MTTIMVLGKPLGQPRQRHAVRHGHAVNYLPGQHPIHGFKLDIRTAWKQPMICGPCRCEIVAVFERPKSKTKKRSANPRLLHTSKPDADNLCKAVCDALNGIAWKDDSQVCDLRITKFIGEPDEPASTTITITDLTEFA